MAVDNPIKAKGNGSKQRSEQDEKYRYIKALFERSHPATSLEIAPNRGNSLLLQSGALDNQPDSSSLMLINPSSQQPPAPPKPISTDDLMDSLVDGTDLNDSELAELLTQLIPEDEPTSEEHGPLDHPAIEFIPSPSATVLPDLFAQNQRVDFALLSGWRPFDYIFTDFFYIDKLLNNNGLILFDHADKPSTRKLCRYIINNLPYQYVSSVRDKSRRPLVEQLLKRHLKRIPIVSDKLKHYIRPEVLDTEYATLLDRPMVALRKVSNDRRTHSFHEAF